MRHAIVMLLAFVSFLSAHEIVFAQSTSVPTTKEFKAYTPGGVNIQTGQFKLSSDDISVGSGEFPSKLTLTKEVVQYPGVQGSSTTLAGGYVTHNFQLTAYCYPCTSGGQNRLAIKAFDGVHVFTGPYVAWGTGRTWTNIASDGASVVDSGGVLEFRARNGDRIMFAANPANGSGIGCGGVCRVPTYAVMAAGQSIVFTYENVTTSGYAQSRLTSVTNSRGYGLRFGYMNPSATTGNVAQRQLFTTVTAFRSGCVSGAVNCTTGALPSISYGWTFSLANMPGEPGSELYRITSYTNPRNRVLNYEYSKPGYSTPYYRMISASYADKPNVKIFNNFYVVLDPNDYDANNCKNGMVVRQENALGEAQLFETNYCAVRPRVKATMKVTSANNAVMTYSYLAEFDDSFIGLPTTVTDPMSRVSTYTYDLGRLTSETNPLGGTISYTLDNRGNITSKVTSKNTTGNESPLSEAYGYPVCDANNFRYCNKPSYVVAAGGGRTDIKYDDLSGMISVVLAPADQNNVRSVTRYNYSAFYPAPGVVVSASNSLAYSYFLTSQDSCLSSNVVGGVIDFSYVCGSGARVRTAFNYTPSTSTSRTNHELESIIRDVDAAAYRTCYRYDLAGNVISDTKPRSMSASCN